MANPVVGKCRISALFFAIITATGIGKKIAKNVLAIIRYLAK
jgi:hypothetical protein